MIKQKIRPLTETAATNHAQYNRTDSITDNDRWGDDLKSRHAGLKAAKQACGEVKNATYVLPCFNTLELADDKLVELKPTDVNDFFVLSMTNVLNRTAALEKVRQQIKINLTPGNNNMHDTAMQKENLIAEIKRLALLNKIDYELSRKEIAKKFEIRETALDEFVGNERKITEDAKSENSLFPTIEPWPESVSLPELLDEIVAILNDYVSFISDHEPTAIALWVIHTHCIKIAYITPSLFVTSAEMRSGKSTVLTILQKIAYKCVSASSISSAALYRLYSKHRPTMICDEADTYMTEKKEDLRGILNAGHSRDTSGVLRVNPDTLEVERFDAFGAKCLAAIKGLPGTVEDRSITIQMRRMTKRKKKNKMRLINEQLRKTFLDIQRKCIRFATDNIEKLKSCNPSLPDHLNDRAAEHNDDLARDIWWMITTSPDTLAELYNQHPIDLWRRPLNNIYARTVIFAELF